jgi:3-hydroxyisobutyrate dehydrogenase
MRIGVAGLGRMGAAMAERLIAVGHEVHVWNRTPAKAKPLVALGAKEAVAASDLTLRCDAVISMLTNAKSLADVYEGPTGLLANDCKGKLFIEMSTVQPHDEEALAVKVKAKGARFVECPVGGTVGPAKSGQLLGVAGGSKEDYAAAEPILVQLCRRVDLVGPVGAGMSLKLALNLPLLIYYQALAEALLLVRHVGLDNKWLMEFLAETSGGPNVLKGRGPAIATALDGGDTGPVTFDIELVKKDLVTMLDEAKRRGVTMPLTAKTLEVYEGALKEGWAPRDAAWLPAYWPSKNPK